MRELSNTRESVVFVLDNVSFSESSVMTLLKLVVQLWGIKKDKKQKRPKGRYVPLVLITEETYHAKFNEHVANLVNHLKVTVTLPSETQTEDMIKKLSLSQVTAKDVGCNWHKLRIQKESGIHYGIMYLGNSIFEQFKMLFTLANLEKWYYLWRLDEEQWINMMWENIPSRVSISQWSNITESLSANAIMYLNIREEIGRFICHELKQYTEYVSLPSKVYFPAVAYVERELVKILQLLNKAELDELMKTEKKKRKKMDTSTMIERRIHPIAAWRGDCDPEKYARLVFENPCPDIVQRYTSLLKCTL
jgi:hypothetical protein